MSANPKYDSAAEAATVKLNLRGLQRITGSQAPAAPELPSYSTMHLRRALSRFAVHFTQRRLAAIIAPLFAAAFFWVTVPALAASLTDSGSGSGIVVVAPNSGTSDTVTSQGTGVPVQPAAQAPAAQAPAAQAPAAQAAPAQVAPAAVPPAQAAPVQAAPAQVAPAATVPAARAAVGLPKTGANDGFLRILLVGICLAISGAALLSAPKRNPHAVFV